MAIKKQLLEMQTRMQIKKAENKSYYANNYRQRWENGNGNTDLAAS
jgi:hypothetical protein